MKQPAATEETLVEKTKNRWWLTAGKILISGALLGFLVWRLPLGTLMIEHQDKLIRLLTISACLLLLAVLFGAVRWWIILRATETPLTFSIAVRLTLIGHFFNQLLPTTVGGDTIRVWGTVEQGYSLGHSATSVILDRFVGLTALLLIVLAGQPILLQRLEVPPMAAVAIVLLMLSGVLACLAMPLMSHLLSRLRQNRLIRFLVHLSSTSRQLFSMPAASAKSLGLSIATQIVLLYLFSLIARDLGADLDFLTAFAVIPTVTLVASLPISIGGWGVREAGLAAAFVLMGLPADLAVLTSLIVGVGNLISGLPGAVIWLLNKRFV